MGFTAKWVGETVDLPDEVKDPKFYERRRQAICYLFEAMGSPEESVWEDGGIVSDLMIRLNINCNSRSSVMAILRDVLKSLDLIWALFMSHARTINAEVALREQSTQRGSPYTS